MVGEWVKEGKIGEVISVNGTFNFSFSSRENVRLIPEFGGGCLWDVGVYPLSFAQFIFGGPPKWVSGTQCLGDTGVDEDFGGLLYYSEDRFAFIQSSFRSPFYTHIEILGSKGRLDLNRPFVGPDDGGRVIYYPEDGEPQTLDVPQKELYLGEVEDMNAAILDGAQNYISLEETRNHVKTVLALLQSARENKLIHLT
jgi:predicted dehydrogenase